VGAGEVDEVDGLVDHVLGVGGGHIIGVDVDEALEGAVGIGYHNYVTYPRVFM
jgi:hypothetical protein